MKGTETEKKEKEKNKKIKEKKKGKNVISFCKNLRQNNQQEDCADSKLWLKYRMSTISLKCYSL